MFFFDWSMKFLVKSTGDAAKQMRFGSKFHVCCIRNNEKIYIKKTERTNCYPNWKRFIKNSKTAWTFDEVYDNGFGNFPKAFSQMFIVKLYPSCSHNVFDHYIHLRHILCLDGKRKRLRQTYVDLSVVILDVMADIIARSYFTWKSSGVLFFFQVRFSNCR